MANDLKNKPTVAPHIVPLQLNERNYRQGIWKSVAAILPKKQRGDVTAAATFLLRLARVAPNTIVLTNSVLLRWLRYIAAKQALSADNIGKLLDAFGSVAYREAIWQEIADLLPWKEQGDIAASVKLLNRLSQHAPSTTRMSNALLLRRIRLIAEKQAITAEGLALILEGYDMYYTKDGFFIAECWDCKRPICLVPDGSDGDIVYNVYWRTRRSGRLHQCDGVSSLSSNNIVNSNHHQEMIGQSFTDQNDGSKGIGHTRRENGKFGSFPVHDNHNEG